MQNNLSKVKDLLSRKRRELETRLRTLSQEDPFADQARLTDNAAIDTEAREEMGHERIEALKLEVSENLARVKKALSKIGIGNYGICDNCGKPIEGERLKVFPMADLCAACSRKLETH